MKTALNLFCLLTFSASLSFAGDCVMKIKRDACPGKDTEAYKPYNGKKETEEKKSAADAAACEKEADKASKIVRKGTLSAKTVTASFDGKDLGKTFSGTAECK